MSGTVSILLHIWAFASLHSDLVFTLIASLLPLLKVTRWGQAHAKALAIVMSAVEQTKDQTVKDKVASIQAAQPVAVQEVLKDTAQLVDPAKPDPSMFKLFLKIAVSKFL